MKQDKFFLVKMEEIDKIAEADSRSGFSLSDDFNHLKDFHNTHEELQKCFSKLKISFITEKELIKDRQKALENIKKIYEEVFGENSYRPLHSYSEGLVEELNNDKRQGTLFREKCFYRNRYANFVEQFHRENIVENHKSSSAVINRACNKCKAMHPDFAQSYDGDESSNVNIKCTNISKENFSDEGKASSYPAKAMYFDGINSFLNNDKNRKELQKSKVHCSETLEDECNDVSSVISRELSKLYNLKDTLRQLEEYDKQMNKKINDVLKLRKDYHCSKSNKDQNFGRKEGLKKKVTVPSPFNLSPSKKCKKSVDMKPIEKKGIFHASPIPSHVYQPLYEELTKNEQKRTERKAASIRKLKANVKPSLSSTNYENYKRDFQSVPDLRDLSNTYSNFKAKPVPCFMYNSFAEKNKREEQKRKFRIKQRSETLLKQSSLPFSERKVSQSRAKNLSKSLDDLSKKPGNKQELDNKIYDSFKKKTTTVCQPFHFRTEERHLNKMKSLKTLYENEYISCTACNTPKKMPLPMAERPTSAPFSHLVSKKTQSSMLRDHFVRQQLRQKQQEMEQELQKLGEKLEKENCFFNKYGWKFKMLDSTENVKKAIQTKLKSNRKMALQRQHEYKTELKEMKERVHRRPLLIEMQAAMSQIGRLQKCFNQALKRAGVDADFVEELSGQYKDWDRSHNTYEEGNADTSCSEQESESDGDNSDPSQSARVTSNESNKNSQHSSRSIDDYAEHSSDYDVTSQCSQQSVISNKELVSSNSESTNAVP